MRNSYKRLLASTSYEATRSQIACVSVWLSQGHVTALFRHRPMHSSPALRVQTSLQNGWAVQFMSVCLLVVNLAGWPTAAQARHWLRKQPAVTDLTGSITRAAYSSWYDGCQDGSCACGIPSDLLKDLNGQAIPYVALNVQVRKVTFNASASMSPTLELAASF